ncbi:MAG TPA: acetylornithine deacetylase [Shinella sp.]|uniref:acetylornithine deacetylase n=1 Tax=Shinella sp. TaxID=1870904 RepID=UPI002E113217|nr:acetylornithine deacetylase [Shinella sp.]
MNPKPAMQNHDRHQAEPILEVAIDILAKLVSFASVSSEPNGDVIAFISDYLSAKGARVERLRSPDQEKENLWVTFGDDADSGGLVLSGHIDVVPVTGQTWTKPPFSLTRDETRVYGRGTTDMKGFLACAMAASDLFQQGKLRRPVHIAVTFDEEVGCQGARELVDFLERRNIRPAAIIVGEPTSMAVVDRHKGSVGFTTEIVGTPAHSSQVHLGQSAIRIASELVNELVVIGEQLMAEAADAAFPYPYPSINVGAIRGGEVRNIVAASCTLDWEIRPIVPQQLVDIRQAFDQHVAEKMRQYTDAGGLIPSIVTHVAYDTPPLVWWPTSEAVSLAMKFADRNDASAVSYGTEAGIYQEAGFSTVVCGPGDIQQAHAADEWIAIDQLEQCLTFMRRLAQFVAEPV